MKITGPSAVEIPVELFKTTETLADIRRRLWG